MRRIAIPAALAPLPDLPGTSPQRVHALGGESMGTYWSAKLVAPDGLSPARLRASIEEVLARIDREMSPWRPESDLNRFNRAPAGSWHDLPEDFFAVLNRALGLARETGGAFDPALGALVSLWGFGPLPRTDIPAPGAVDAARRRASWREITLDHGGRRARQPGGAVLDLCGIAKGYAVDLMAAALTREGVASHLVEIGGELRGFGTKPDGQPWWVALERPPGMPAGPGAPAEIVVALHGLSVATSGDYRRSFEADGQRYAHTLDPATGCPLTEAPASVTVLHPACMEADALATALTVLGPKEGLSFAGCRGLAARFIVQAGNRFEERISPAFAAMLAD